MIRLISYGDHLEKGQYQVHSRFRRVVNFVSGNQLASVVHPAVGGGPFNLVLDSADLTVLNHLSINDDSFSLNDEIFYFDESKKFDSEIKLHGFYEKLFKENLHYFEEILIQHAHEKSLVFLLDPVRRLHFKTGFEKELLSRFDSSMNYFNSSDIIGAVRMMKGAGFGLTPSGDDFIAGWMQALNLTGKIFKTDHSEMINHVHQESQSNNILTSSFLSASSKGWLTENFKNLINSLLCGDIKRIQEEAQTVLTHGATSGADWCVGFLNGIKMD